MTPNLATSLDRADELLAELLVEYDACLRSKSVSARAIQLTHDVCERLRSVLDRTARRYWEVRVSPAITEDDRKAALIYFPICKNAAAMDSTLGRWRWKAVRADNQEVYDYLLAQQPFIDAKNNWLTVTDDLAIASKHIDLVPQTRTEQKRVIVSRGAATVSYDPGAVRFGSGVFIAGAPVNPATQRVVPTEGVTERIETWVSFLVGGHNINAAGLCKEACAGTRRIATEMFETFDLS